MKRKNYKTQLNPSMIFAIFAFIVVILIVTFAFVLFNSSPQKKPEILYSQVEVLDGVQIVPIYAKNGFTPSKVTLKSDTQTRLKVTTNETIDCSNVISIPKIQLQKNLPVSGTAEVDIPPQKSGTSLTATCSMGLYTLQIDFI